MKKAIICAVLFVAMQGMAFAGGRAEVERPDRVTVVIGEPNAESFLFWKSHNAEYLDMMIEPLIGTDPVTGELSDSRIVESWEHNEDFTEWTLNLRQDVEFHNDWGGATAEDVVHSFELHTGGDAIQVGVDQIRDGNASVIDDYTVRVEFPTPRRDFAFNIAGRSTIHLYSKAQYEAGGIEAYENEPTGTGPFQYVSHEPGQVLYRRVEDHYSGTTAGFEELELRFVAEPSTRYAMLQTGEADIAELPRELHQDARNRGFEFVSSEQPAMQTTVTMNGLFLTSEEQEENPELYEKASSLPWADVRIREALNRAIDRHEMLDILFDARGADLVVKYAMHEPHEGFEPSLVDRFPDEYGYDPDRARDLMQDAGYPDDFDDPTIPLIRTQIAGQPELDVQTDLLYEYLTAVGFDARIVEMDSTTMFARGRDRESFYLNPTRNAPIRPTSAAITIFHTRAGTPGRGYETDRGTGLVRQIENTYDPQERDSLIRELFTYLFESYEDIPLFEVYTKMAINPDTVSEWQFAGDTTYGFGHWHLIQPAR